MKPELVFLLCPGGSCTMLIRATTSAALIATVLLMPIRAQEKSVRPGVNDTFRDPDPKAFTERFEIESREVFAKRKEILEAGSLGGSQPAQPGRPRQRRRWAAQ